MERLSAVQIALKVPKGQTNDFGHYKYRNCEDILEAVKPILADNGLTLLISDELLSMGERYYVRATAAVSVTENTDPTYQRVAVTAYAREELDKKGMDGSQITGAASSYARKYALNGLFLIDDTKDSDATNDHGKAPAATSGYVAPAAPVAQAVTPASAVVDNHLDFTGALETLRIRMAGAGLFGDAATNFIQAACYKKKPINIADIDKINAALDKRGDRELGQMS